MRDFARRLAALESKTTREPGFISLGLGWLRIGRGLFVPGPVGADEWEAVTSKAQAELIAGKIDPDRERLDVELREELHRRAAAIDEAARKNGRVR